MELDRNPPSSLPEGSRGPAALGRQGPAGGRASSNKRESLERWLVQLGFSGQVPNSRAANLHAIDGLLLGEPFYTFGIDLVDRAVATGGLDQGAVLDVMTHATGCHDQAEFLSDPGRINPRATLEGLASFGRLLRQAASRRLKVALGTGHPGAMLSCYIQLAAWLKNQGCHVLEPPAGSAGVDWQIDCIEGVVVTSDGCGVLHGHATCLMKALLTKEAADLVIADHGHAGAAINARRPCVAVMDTNDPALAVAYHLGATDLLVIPIYDNRPNRITRALADVLIAIAEDRPYRSPVELLSATAPAQP